MGVMTGAEEPLSQGAGCTPQLELAPIIEAAGVPTGTCPCGTLCGATMAVRIGRPATTPGALRGLGEVDSAQIPAPLPCP
jgi:hypothetical protein